VVLAASPLGDVGEESHERQDPPGPVGDGDELVIDVDRVDE